MSIHSCWMRWGWRNSDRESLAPWRAMGFIRVKGGER